MASGFIRGSRKVGYGYALYRGGAQVATGAGAVCSTSHVFDAEAIGAWRGLERAIALVTSQSCIPKIWLCVDSTSVIWCIRGTAPASSQWAFLKCQEALATHGVGVRWAPGHMGIEGNETAAGADMEPDGQEALPTISGIGSLLRDMKKAQQQEWWTAKVGKLSAWYRAWEDHSEYKVKELDHLKG